MWMIQTALPQEVPEKIHQLLEKYHNAEKITLYDIAKFHAQFENIHPFQDGNVPSRYQQQIAA